ncbi:MAG: TonB-dependent siderophore receptor [Moraxella sp.]|nr:TonB-dependent siderophore receptor [Moraxella sp.]
MMNRFSLSLLTLGVLAALATPAIADDTVGDNADELTTDIPSTDFDDLVVNVSAEAGKYVAIKPVSLKDDRPLYQTARSISVLTPQQVEQKQATTIAELLENVAGVTSGVQGRRGWDDFIIRGQVSSAQTYVDGMRVQTSTNNLRAWDVAAAETIEVIKGPATEGYGAGLPGGMVNITSKRPQAETFYNATLTGGSFGLKEIAYDMNIAPNDSTKGAFRVNGRYNDRDDATDFVYFKNFYVAPSYTFDVGNRTNLTVLGSYQWREWVRQQGLPHNNTYNVNTGILTVHNAHEAYAQSTFFGVPSSHDNQQTLRLGYDLSHDLTDNIKLKSIFAVTKTDTDGAPVLANGYTTFYNDGEIGRRVNYQDKHDTMYTMDNRINAGFETGVVSHDVTLGVDMLHERSHYTISQATATPVFDADLDNAANYDNITIGTATQTRDWLDHTQDIGVYLKDNITYNDWTLGLNVRQDFSKVARKGFSVSSGTRIDLDSTRSERAFTGGASLMYDYHGRFAPYISYATSFNPNIDTGIDGEVLDSETGKQTEVGVKFQGFDRHLQGYLSYYDLTRNNVAEDVLNANGRSLGYAELIGEQRTKGLELEAALVLNNQWNISGSYSYIPTAKIVESNIAADIGERLSQIPKHAASISTQYHFDPSRLGWYVGGGVRYQGDRTAWRTTAASGQRAFMELGDYYLLDLKAGYEAEHWGLGVAVKNVLNEDYLVGTTPNAQLVAFGEPRNVRVSLKFKY